MCAHMSKTDNAKDPLLAHIQRILSSYDRLPGHISTKNGRHTGVRSRSGRAILRAFKSSAKTLCKMFHSAATHGKWHFKRSFSLRCYDSSARTANFQAKISLAANDCIIRINYAAATCIACQNRRNVVLFRVSLTCFDQEMDKRSAPAISC